MTSLVTSLPRRASTAMINPMGKQPRPAPANPLSARCRPAQGQADGLVRLSGRIPATRGRPINHLVAGAAPAPRAPRYGWLPLAPAAPSSTRGRSSPRTGRPPAEPLTENPSRPNSLPPAARHDPLPGGRIKGACGAADAGTLRVPLTRPPARRNRQPSRGQGAESGNPKPGQQRLHSHCHHRADTGKGVSTNSARYRELAGTNQE